MNPRRPADVRIFADGHEMMHPRPAHHVHMAAADHVARDHDVIRQHAVIGKLGVMSDMAVGHQQIVVADAGDALAAALVPMWTVTPSRKMLPSPISRRVGSSRYFLSCGVSADHGVGMKMIVLARFSSGR